MMDSHNLPSGLYKVGIDRGRTNKDISCRTWVTELNGVDTIVCVEYYVGTKPLPKPQEAE